MCCGLCGRSRTAGECGRVLWSRLTLFCIPQAEFLRAEKPKEAIDMYTHQMVRQRHCLLVLSLLFRSALLFSSLFFASPLLSDFSVDE